jgi:hypothetical protein
MQGCGGGSTSPAGTNPGLPSAISVTIQPSAAQVVAGKTQIFQASVTGSSDTTVNWNLQEGPSGGSVTSTGIYSAPFSSGAYHIIASSRADPTKSAIATITVPTEAPAVSSVTPFAALMGVGSVTVSVIGSNFFPTSVVNFNGSALATTYDSSTTLTAVIPSFDLTQASINTLSVSNPTLGGGVSGLLEFSVVDPAQISVVVSPRNVNVPVGKTKTFAASVIGSPDTTVSWSINGIPGGNNTVGTITQNGVYTAPVAAPPGNSVSVTATSSLDSSKSASMSVGIVPVLESATQIVTALAGGTIQLSSGSNVVIPPGALSQDCNETLELTSASAQSVNDLFSGLGPSLILSCSPLSNALSAKNNLTVLASNVGSSIPITFTIQATPPPNAPLQNAVGIADVNTGTDNYFGSQLLIDTFQNTTTLQVDSQLLASNSSVQIGVATLPPGAITQSGDAVLQVWETLLGVGPAFFDPGPGYCPTGRTIVMIHGMLSSPQDAFGSAAAPRSIAGPPGTIGGPYKSVVGIKYDWWLTISPNSAQSVATILNSLFDGPCTSSPEFDIEAHSEGAVVTLAALGNMTANTRSKLKHIILVAGPLDGTPLANDTAAAANNVVSYYANKILPFSADIFMPVNATDMYGFVGQLKTDSDVVLSAQASAEQFAKSMEVIAIGGNVPDLPSWVTDKQKLIFGTEPNDGVVPLSSALPTNSIIPNLVFLGPYPLGHRQLVNDPNVIADIINAVNGQGAPSQVSINSISPSAVAMNPGDTVSLTANVTSILNPAIAWKASAGTFDKTTGATVNYTAPQTPGNYVVTAQLEALPAVSQSANITVGGPQAGIPTISSFTWNSTPVANQPFSGTITGTGFISPVNVFFCLTSTSTCFKHPSAGVTINNSQSLSLVNVELSSGSWQFYVQNGTGQSARSKPFDVQAIASIPTISGYSWGSTPAANQPFDGTVTGSGFFAPVNVFFCINGSNTCFQHPAAGVNVIGPDSINLVNVQLGSGSYQIYVQTSGGQSSRSVPFSVQAAPAPTITGYAFNSTPTAQQPFSGSGLFLRESFEHLLRTPFGWSCRQ